MQRQIRLQVPQLDSMRRRFRSADSCLRNFLPRRFQPDTPEKQLDAMPELSCDELNCAGHRWPEFNLKRELAWHQRFRTTRRLSANTSCQINPTTLGRAYSERGIDDNNKGD